MKRSDNKFTTSSKIILYLLPILGVTGIIVPLIFGKSNLSLLSVYLAAPMILATIIHVKQSEKETNFEIYNNKLFPLFVSLYFIFISVSIYILYLFDIRPYIYYLIIAATFVLILMEILLFDISRNKEIIILIQIAMLFVNLIWGVTLKYDLFIGRTDMLFHSFVIKNLIESGHVTDLFENYKPFPLWHILCAFMYKVLAIPFSIQKTMSFTSGIIFSFFPIVAYLISTKIFKDKKASLLAALFVVLHTDIILYGMASISRSIVSFVFVMLILVLLDANNPRKSFLSIILIFSLIVYHPASMPFILLILLGIYIMERFYDQENNVFLLSLNFMTLAVVMTFYYWFYYSQSLLVTFKENILEPAPIGVLTKSVILTPLNELFNYLQFSPLLLFLIVGFYAAMNSKKISTLGKIFCIIGLFTVPIAFPGPSLLINKLANNLQVDRFVIYAFLFIGVTSAIGFQEMYTKSKKYTKVCVIILFTAMIFLSISNDFDASDNPLVKRPFYTFYFTNEEETAIHHLASITEGTIMSDYPTYLYLYYSKYRNMTNVLELDNEEMKFLKNQTNDIFLIRKSELSKRPLRLYSTYGGSFVKGSGDRSNLDYYYQDNIIWANIDKYNKVYDSTDIIGYN